jgi:hypothetical protein
MKRTISEIVKANQAIGHYYFSADTMGFFNSKINEETYDAGSAGTVFVVSDKFDDEGPRRYVPRLAHPSGSIDSLMNPSDAPTSRKLGHGRAISAARLLAAGKTFGEVREFLATL